MSEEIHPVLLCGGSGTRLWPLSRRSYPKQFTSLLGKESLFQSAARRLSGPGFVSPTVVTGADLRFTVTEQLSACGVVPARILIEPAARNTAPAILAAALDLRSRVGDALMLVAPSDHMIPDTQGFRAAVQAAVPVARQGDLVTFGIRADRPEIGYGWLELATPPTTDFPPVAQKLLRFVEKPDAGSAQAMMESGRHLWNAGIYLFTNRSIIEAFGTHAPGFVELVRAALDGAERELDFTRLAHEPWTALEDISIDYAVMEKSKALSVVPYGGVWSDLGGWEAVWRECEPDSVGFVAQGQALGIDCTGSLLRAEAEDQQLVGIGLQDIIAVAMPDAVLVAHKSRAQDVKQAVATLKEQGVAQAETFAHEHRPWGWFECLARGPRFQVKRIVVHPGATLSLQSHHHRAEHWIVVEGTARVTIGDTVQLIGENQSIFIPLREKHRLENPGKQTLTLIEVQTGAYLGEDDIIRHDDPYAREKGM